MQMPGRNVSSSFYRYGFNGKEKAYDIASDNYDFGARVYDGRIARWLSVDPLQKKYVGQTPFSLSLNNPIVHIDPDGNSVEPYNVKATQYSNNTIVITGDVRIKIQILNLSKNPNNELNLYDLRDNLRQSLNDMLNSPATRILNTPITIKDHKMVYDKKPSEKRITYNALYY